MADAIAIQWQNDVDAALEEAKRSGRPVLIDFTAAPA
ncbi:MAG TPA: thioredoxin family protein [Gemmatimonadaceae bacterium]|nr:thioredoxin family protein [Gemmatimonadaceae bacterium]